MTTHVPMAAARQPFAPLDSSRLQTLTSLKNRQNAISSTPGKRKAEVFEEDGENVDPIVFSSPKKSKALDGVLKEFSKPRFILTEAPSTPSDLTSPIKGASAPRPTSRRTFQSQTPSTRIDTSISKSTPLTAPAGRSPTRKRIGILNRHRATPFSRVDPPKFASSSAAPFSLDAALSGTITGYGAKSAPRSRNPASSKLRVAESEVKASWFFEIHEDTPEEHMTNMIEHSTLTMDLSSDDEESVRARNDRGKENVPPMDDASQTRLPAAAPAEADAGRERAKSRHRKEVELGAIDVDRSPLGNLAAEDFYGEGCCEETVVFVHDDEDAETIVDEQEYRDEPECDIPKDCAFEFVAESQLTSMGKGKGKDLDTSHIDELMQKNDAIAAPQAAVLGPIEKAEEGWTVYESDSAKGEN